jgi:hypothetical protein
LYHMSACSARAVRLMFERRANAGTQDENALIVRRLR